MLTGDLKKELINVLTPIVSAHQEKRKTVTDQDVLDFMAPRQLNFNVQPVFKVVAPFLDQECLDKLDQHLKDHRGASIYYVANFLRILTIPLPPIVANHGLFGLPPCSNKNWGYNFTVL